MAQALVCDRCKAVFAKTTRDATTGRWNHSNFVDKDGRRYRLVYGVFELPATTGLLYKRLREEEEPQGRALDVCTNCVKELIGTDIEKEEEVPANDDVPERSDQG